MEVMSYELQSKQDIWRECIPMIAFWCYNEFLYNFCKGFSTITAISYSSNKPLSFCWPVDSF